MCADISRKQKKKEKKIKEQQADKLKNMTEIEKEAHFHNEQTVVDESVRAKHTPEHVIVDNEVIDRIVATISDGGDIDDKNVQEEHHDFLAKHPEIKKHEVMILLSIIAILAVILSVQVSVNMTKTSVIEDNSKVIKALNLQLDTEKTNETKLQEEVDELNLKVNALSESVAAKTEEVNMASEELRLLKLPSAYPLKGTAAIITLDNTEEDEDGNNNADTDEIEDTEDTVQEEYDEMAAEETTEDATIDKEYKNNPYTIFTTAQDTKVVATGLGKVVAVVEDEEFGYAIKIDHENGYFSIYRGYGMPMIAEGDIVSAGCDLMRIAEDNKYFLYQIIYEGSYVDPMSIMEING